MKPISAFVLGFAAACASAAAPAQDLTAGKTPAQLFRSDCAECHHSPNGITRTRDVRALTDFLREHYTTKSETASALAVYVSSFAVTGAAGRNRGTGAAPAAANVESGKTAAPKVRKRRNRMENAEAPDRDAPVQTKTNAEVPAAIEPAVPPREGNISPSQALPAANSPPVEQ